ncbi:PGF-pre-PGF domain-containing protein [Candidatus Woesearchaeota archaeon]|nr:PGF-pre-PGF domain-containing protein [Candidatus Woesearchaeota archaeon]
MGSVKFALISGLIILAFAASALAQLPHAHVITGDGIAILGQQYFNFSTGTTSDTQGDIQWDNRSGIQLDFSSSSSNGFFNTTTGKLEGLGPNIDLNKTYKVPASGGSTTFGEAFYVDSTFPIFSVGDGVAVKTINETFAAFKIDSVNDTHLYISYRYNPNGSNILAATPTTGCAQHQNESACYDASSAGAHCYWDYWLELCNEVSGGSGGAEGGGEFSGGNYVQCYKFESNGLACGNITVCNYNANSGTCDPTSGFSYDVGLNCSVMNNQTLCDNQPHTSPLCSWNGTACLANNSKTAAEVPPPAFTTCDAAPTENDCTNLSTSAFMPCEWTGSACKVVFNSVFGGSGTGFGSIFDCSTKTSCEATGGKWHTETYSYENQYGQTQTTTASWCEPSFGDTSKEECADSCWACEYKPDGTSWGTGASAIDAAKVACQNSSVGYCQFYEDSNAINGLGWCEPSGAVSFGYADCSQNCYGCINNASCAGSAATCTWTSDPQLYDLDGNGSFDSRTDGWCDPAALALQKNCDVNCMGCSTETECLASAANVSVGGCTWDSSYYYCSNTSASGVEICFFPGDEDGNGLYDCADPACAQSPSCGFGGAGALAGAGLASVDPYLCIQHDNDQTNCNNQQGPSGTPLASTSICYYHPAPGKDADFPTTGWCDSAFEQQNSAGINIDSPPVILGIDPSDDVEYQWLDIVGFGIHDSPESVDIGIGVKNMTNFTGCYKSFIGTPGRYNASGKYYRYLDTDENTTNGCLADNDASIKGFEYKFIRSANNNASNATIYEHYNATFDTTTAYKCISGNWTAFSAQLQTMQDACSVSEGGIGGIDIMLIKKTDIGSPKVPVRIYVATHNGSNTTIDAAGPEYYTPGSIDFKFENCAATGQDFDGDGLNAENDPDCQKYIKLGYVPFETGVQCNDGKDNDGNGLTDCNDFSCKYDPYIGCGFALTCDTADKSAPTVKWQSVDALLDSAHISFDSNEPANGTLLFYNLSSKCTELNETVKDIGLLDTLTDNDHKLWHDADLDSNNLKYSLDKNTTYFFKYQMCDLCGNCLVSKCTNFTTATAFKTYIFKPVLDAAITMSIPVLNITNESFTYGKQLNQSQTANIDIMLNDTANSCGITFENCTVTKAFNVNMSGAFVYNSTSKACGMNTDKWNEISQELGCKNIKIKIPTSSQQNQLWHCDDDNVSNCYRVDDSNLVTCTYDSTSAECSIAVAQGLGFSVYEPRSSSSSSSSSSTSSGGGGGGGGGGGAAKNASNYISKVTRVWDLIAAEDRKLLSLDSEEIVVSLVSFAVSEEIKNAEVTVGNIKKLPDDVPAPTGVKVFQHLQIEHDKIDNDKVLSSTIEFRVPLSWLTENNFQAADISLYRYTSKWDELATTHLSSDAENAYYQAASPGLSYFVVAAKQKAAVQETAPKEITGEAIRERQTAADEQQAGQPTMPKWAIYAALTAVVVIAAIILEEKKRRSQKKK